MEAIERTAYLAAKAKTLSRAEIFEGIPEGLIKHIEAEKGPRRSGFAVSASLWVPLPEEQLSRDSNVRRARICNRDEEIIRSAAWFLKCGGNHAEELDEFIEFLDRVLAPEHPLDGQVHHQTAA